MELSSILVGGPSAPVIHSVCVLAFLSLSCDSHAVHSLPATFHPIYSESGGWLVLPAVFKTVDPC